MFVSGEENNYVAKRASERTTLDNRPFLQLKPENAAFEEIVVGVNSCSKEDWAKTYLFDSFLFTLCVSGFLEALVYYAWRQLDIKPSVFIRSFCEDFLSTPYYLSHFQSQILESLNKQLLERLYQDGVVDISYFEFELEGSGYLLKTNAVMNFLVLQNPEAFFNGLNAWFKDCFGKNNGFEDLVNWIKSTTRSINYNPEKGRLVETKFDWQKWISNADWISMPEVGNYRYMISDQTYKLGDMEFPIDWHLLEPAHLMEFLVISLVNKIELTHTFINLISLLDSEPQIG